MAEPMDPGRLLATFLDLVRIDSPSGHEGGVARYCQGELESFGAKVRIDGSAARTGSDTGNLIAELPGSMPGIVYFSAHMDTVAPGCGIVPVIQDGIISSEGATILGGDDKVGVAALLEALRVVASSGEAACTVRLLLTVQEELSLLGAKALAQDEFVQGAPCYVLDAAGRPGTIVRGAPYQHTYDALFTGRAAHAGVCPEEGVSAITAAASAIGNLPCGRLDDVTTANVGTIRGGVANNIVAEGCRVTGECRSQDAARLARLHDSIDAAIRKAAEDHGCRLELSWEENYQGFYFADDDPLCVHALAAAAAAGLDPRLDTTGGGADTNVFIQRGLAAVSLATGMDNIHSTEERLAVADLEDLTRFVLALIRSHSGTAIQAHS